MANLMNLVSEYGREPTQARHDAIYSQYLADCDRCCKTVPGGVTPTHKHVKRGSEYVLLGYGKMQAEDWVTDHGRDGSRLVDMLEVAIYRCVHDGTLWVRPKEEFNDGRFMELRPL